MYKAFYNFTDWPFRLTPDPTYLFLDPKHEEALNRLWFGVTQKSGFVQLTGEVGCGKTTVCRALLEQLDEHYPSALILNPVMTETQLLQTILREFKIDLHDQDDGHYYEILNNYLLEQASQAQAPVLIIDEAQDLSPELLELVRLLSNLETDDQKLIQIILIGQPELRETLKSRQLRQLRQRITVRYHLQPLTRSETHRYVDYRLSVAGARGLPYFDQGAVKRIHHYSRGIPRLINAVADKALLAGFVHKRHRINRKMVHLAEKELEGDIDESD